MAVNGGIIQAILSDTTRVGRPLLSTSLREGLSDPSVRDLDAEGHVEERLFRAAYGSGVYARLAPAERTSAGTIHSLIGYARPQSKQVVTGKRVAQCGH
jgi:hypothetical protein